MRIALLIITFIICYYVNPKPQTSLSTSDFMQIDTVININFGTEINTYIQSQTKIKK